MGRFWIRARWTLRGLKLHENLAVKLCGRTLQHTLRQDWLFFVKRHEQVGQVKHALISSMLCLFGSAKERSMALGSLRAIGVLEEATAATVGMMDWFIWD